MTIQQSNQTDVSPAQRSRMAAIEQKLAAGINPYAKDPHQPTPEAGGTFKEREKRQAEHAATQERTPDNMVRLEQKWKELPKVAASAASFDAPELQGPAFREGFPTIKGANGQEMPNPDYRACSFCGVPVHIKDVTLGVSTELIKSRKQEPVRVGDTVVYRERVTHFTPKLAACKNCVLSIKPTVDDETGIVTKNNTKIETKRVWKD